MLSVVSLTRTLADAGASARPVLDVPSPEQKRAARERFDRVEALSTDD
ncbi:MAG: hypothetical protein HYV09_23500 [Deltaproteobacteria bacterium]|nr:hypothetical protein [Deltaproteobacteria bacterium]